MRKAAPRVRRWCRRGRPQASSAETRVVSTASWTSPTQAGSAPGGHRSAGGGAPPEFQTRGFCRVEVYVRVLEEVDLQAIKQEGRAAWLTGEVDDVEEGTCRLAGDELGLQRAQCRGEAKGEECRHQPNAMCACPFFFPSKSRTTARVACQHYQHCERDTIHDTHRATLDGQHVW